MEENVYSKICYEGNIISFVETKIPVELFKSNKDSFDELMQKLTDEFIKLQLFKGNELLDYAKNNNIDIGESYILFKHKIGQSLMRARHNVSTSSYRIKKEPGYNEEVGPLISVFTSCFRNGWTFDTGLFADVYIVNNNDYICFSTRDTLPIHNLYIYWITEELGKRFSNYKYQGNYECLYINPAKLCQVTKPISKEFNSYISRNKTKRIDLLKCNGQTVADYIRTVIIYKYVHSDEKVYKGCMLFGKTYEQMKSYIEKVL